jgi:hypothetical protein
MIGLTKGVTADPGRRQAAMRPPASRGPNTSVVEPRAAWTARVVLKVESRFR